LFGTALFAKTLFFVLWLNIKNFIQNFFIVLLALMFATWWWPPWAKWAEKFRNFTMLDFCVHTWCKGERHVIRSPVCGTSISSLSFEARELKFCIETSHINENSYREDFWNFVWGLRYGGFSRLDKQCRQASVQVNDSVCVNFDNRESQLVSNPFCWHCTVAIFTQLWSW